MAKRKRKIVRTRTIIGWREWLSLPTLGIERVKVKVDTGARTSSLHAFDLRPERIDGVPWIRFQVHPLQRDAQTTVEVLAPLVDERRVRPSTGRVAVRPVIRANAVLGAEVWPIEITLTNRDMMGFRMLLGRQALRRRFLVDAARSYLGGEPEESSS